MHDEHASLAKTLDVITRAAVELVPGAEHAGITLVARGSRFESRAATSALPGRIDELQYTMRDGPCVQAIWEKETIRVDDMEHEDRWPAFASEAARLGAHSMLAVRLYTTDDTVGALNLHSSQVGAFDDDSVDIASTLATHAAFAAVAAVREEQFRAALASRDVIGQAKGVLMERFGLDAESAFEMLRRLSQERNQLVRDLAVEVVETARPPRER
ncbi:GAF and ANTAR domain-containing protein [Rhodococcus pyridinivorans]|uniref:GAF and ANTAR domain-containing protein n=1 Tax=Rhodococcus pyridinivorans TaxID=103816 RepID=UPI0002EE841E|nr:GAF and ANTAR domain-containing protein [Rhodococcus pyridinivorans]